MAMSNCDLGSPGRAWMGQEPKVMALSLGFLPELSDHRHSDPMNNLEVVEVVQVK